MKTDKPGMIRHGERNNSIYICGEKLSKEHNLNFPFMIHSEWLIRLVLVFKCFFLQVIWKIIAKLHSFPIADKQVITNLELKTTSIYYLSHFPGSGVWVWVNWILCSGSHQKEIKMSDKTMILCETSVLFQTLIGKIQFPEGTGLTTSFTCWLSAGDDFSTSSGCLLLPAMWLRLHHSSLLLQGQEESACYIFESFRLLFLTSRLFYKCYLISLSCTRRHCYTGHAHQGVGIWGAILQFCLSQRSLSTSALRFRKALV